MDAPTQEELTQLAILLKQFGCPESRIETMAAQLDKRARQLAKEKGKTYQEALVHLLGLMRKGWAAKEKGL